MQEHFIYRNFLLKVAVLQEGREPLTLCNMCRIHMPLGWMIKHWRTARCFNNMDIRIRQRDVEFASRCLEMEFRLTGEEEEETIEGVALFKYLGRPLEQSDYYW